MLLAISLFAKIRFFSYLMVFNAVNFTKRISFSQKTKKGRTGVAKSCFTPVRPFLES